MFSSLNFDSMISVTLYLISHSIASILSMISIQLLCLFFRSLSFLLTSLLYHCAIFLVATRCSRLIAKFGLVVFGSTSGLIMCSLCSTLFLLMSMLKYYYVGHVLILKIKEWQLVLELLPHPLKIVDNFHTTSFQLPQRIR